MQINFTYVKHLKQYLASRKFCRNVSLRGKGKDWNRIGIEYGSIKKATEHSALECAMYTRLVFILSMLPITPT